MKFHDILSTFVKETTGIRNHLSWLLLEFLSFSRLFTTTQYVVVGMHHPSSMICSVRSWYVSSINSSTCTQCKRKKYIIHTITIDGTICTIKKKNQKIKIFSTSIELRTCMLYVSASSYFFWNWCTNNCANSIFQRFIFILNTLIRMHVWYP